MNTLKDARDLVRKPGSNIHWVRLLITFIALIGLSFAFAAIAKYIQIWLHLETSQFELATYLVVFFSTLIANLTIIAPVPFAVAIMLAAARQFNPVLVALCAAAGGTLGEMSGYYAGRLGRKIAIPDSLIGYRRVEHWINKYGIWAITFLGFQPVIPFDIGGLVAGAARMPIYKFLPALFAGKFPKYIVLIYIYISLPFFNFLPSWLRP